MKKSVRFLLLMMVTLLCISGVFAHEAPNPGKATPFLRPVGALSIVYPQSDCDHDWGNWTTISAATCSKEGQRARECRQCGGQDYATIPRRSHNIVEVVTPPSSCTTNGKRVRKCSYCSYQESYEVINAPGHDFGSWRVTKSATCTADGVKVRECMQCGYEESGSIGKTGHSLEEVVTKQPTCTQTGTKVTRCKKCSYQKSSVTLDALGHDYSDWTVALRATCTEEGRKEQTCRNCSNVNSTKIPKLPHVIKEVTSSPSCETNGYRVNQCEICGYQEGSPVTIPALGHDYSTWTGTVSATCTRPGEKMRECRQCGYQDVAPIPALGHNLKEVIIQHGSCVVDHVTAMRCTRCNYQEGDNIVKTAPGHDYSTWTGIVSATCTKPGKKMRECRQCGYQDVAPIPALGHNLKEVIVQHGSCVVDRVTAMRCTRCNHQEGENIVTPAPGHDYSTWTGTVSATCIKPGEKMRECRQCGYQDVEEIPILGHDLKEVIVQHGSCVVDRVTAMRCTRCNHQEGENIVTPAPGHDYSTWTGTVSATCTKPGEKMRECRQCGYQDVEEIPILGHDLKEVIVQHGSCVEDRVTAMQCTRCDYQEGENIVTPAPGHDYSTWTGTVSATCTKPGEKMRECRQCGYQDVEEIPILGHDLKEVIVQHGSCVVDRVTAMRCTRCNHQEGENIVTPAPGHDYSTWTGTVSATCTEPGEKMRECRQCGYQQIEIITPPGHSMVEVVKEPTCSELGQKVIQCKKCGYQEGKPEILGKLAHDYTEWVVISESTCILSGDKRRECRQCGFEEITFAELAEHKFGDWTVVRESTCMSYGEQERTCIICNYKEFADIESYHHVYKDHYSAPSCTSKGTRARLCAICCHIEGEIEYIPPLGHDLKEVIVQHGSCVVDHVTAMQCTRCNHQEGENIVTPAPGHDYSTWTGTVSATCNKPGEKMRECRQCGYQDIAVIPTLGHNLKEVIVQHGSCVEDHVTTMRCTRCNYQEGENIVTPAPGHDYSTWTGTVSATCTKPGEKMRECRQCGYQDVEEIPILGHDLKEVIVQHGSCVENRVTAMRCTRCNYQEGENIVTPAPGHDYSTWMGTVSATCTKPGEKMRECRQCGYQDVEEIPILGHDLKEVIVQHGSCVEDRVTAMQCTRCNHQEGDNIVTPAPGHDYSTWMGTVSATCTKPGEKMRECRQCGHQDMEEIPILGHDLKEVIVQHGSCVEDRVTAMQCTRCNHQEGENIVTPAPGHDYSTWTGTVSATCTKPGEKMRECRQCGYQEITTIAAYGHTLEQIVITQASCNREGRMVQKCKRCGYQAGAPVIIPALNHDFGIWTVTVKPTNTSEGRKMRECRQCGYQEFVSMATVISKEVALDPSVKILHSLNLASDISVNYVVSRQQLEQYDSYYLSCEVPIYEGNTLVGSNTVEIEPELKDGYYYFTMDGLNSTQMNDTLRCVLYMDRDGISYRSIADDYSVTKYAYSQLNKTASSDELRVFCADLLRYGSAAQSFKGYRTDALADGTMTEAHRAFLTNLETVSFGNTNEVLDDLANPTVTWVGKSLNLESKVILKYVISTSAYSGSIEDLSLRLSYENLSGETVVATLTNPVVYNAASSQYAFSFHQLPAAELRNVVSAQVYAGDTPVSATLQYSVDTYGRNKTGTLGNLCQALMAYSDSAKLFFSLS